MLENHDSRQLNCLVELPASAEEIKHQVRSKLKSTSAEFPGELDHRSGAKQ